MASAYAYEGVVVATDGSHDRAMRAAFVALGNRVPARSVAMFGSEMSVGPELTGIALALEYCPAELGRGPGNTRGLQSEHGPAAKHAAGRLPPLALQTPCSAAPCAHSPPNQSARSRWSSYAAGQSQGLRG
jgi:hypothetical protein